jgi:hypothetical protein
MNWESPSSTPDGTNRREEIFPLARIRAELRRVRAPESLRARIAAMLAVERCAAT